MLGARHPEGVDARTEFHCARARTWTSQLRFNVRIDGARSRVLLVAPDGTSSTLTLASQAKPDILQTRATGLKPGAYKLQWKVLASDGHMSSGEIPFTVNKAEMLVKLVDLFSFLSVVLRAGTLVFQSVLLGGVLFVLWIARRSPDASDESIAGCRRHRGSCCASARSAWRSCSCSTCTLTPRC